MVTISSLTFAGYSSHLGVPMDCGFDQDINGVRRTFIVISCPVRKVSFEEL